MSGIFAEIRAAAAAVASQARYVRVNRQAVADLASRIQLDDVDDDPGHGSLGDAESTAAFVLALDAVNFGSGYFPHLRKRPASSGYHTVAACLRDHAEQHGPITPQWLLGATTSTVTQLFEQAPAGSQAASPEALELMALFARAFNHLGQFINQVGGGTALGVLRSAGGSAQRLVQSLATMPLYRDVHRYRGMDVPLYKRAQITAYDIATALHHEPPATFADIDDLTMFADNLVPHVLRIEGVLEFDASLVARIDAGEDISSGSEPEIEIRACGLHSVELLAAGVRAAGRRCVAAHVDGVLWRMGGRQSYKALPRHRTRCTFY